MSTRSIPASVFTPLLGQPQAIELLQRALEQQRIAPAYLFIGAAGVGRRLAADCFAEALLADRPPSASTSRSAVPEHLHHRIAQRNHPDLLWVEPTYLHQGKRLSATEAAEQGVKRKAPPEIRLDQIRELAQFLSRPPLEARRSVVVVEGAETMAEAAANGLLKTLEEPGRATLILIAPSPDSLLPTLVSRCQRIPFRRLPPETIADILRQTEHADLLQHPDILTLAQGSPGAAIAHWQQLQSIPADLLETVLQPPTSLKNALAIARQIHQTLDTEAQLWLIDYLQQSYWHRCPYPQSLHLFEQARRQLLQFVQPRLVWEVALMEIWRMEMGSPP